MDPKISGKIFKLCFRMQDEALSTLYALTERDIQRCMTRECITRNMGMHIILEDSIQLERRKIKCTL